MADGLEPVPLAMVLCDAIHVDTTTGKRTLLGLFTAVFSSEYPVRLPALSVYASITECRGTFPIVLQVVDANEEREPICRIEGEASYDNPLGILELDFRLGVVEFPEPGEYRVQLFAAGAFLIERRLGVFDPSTFRQEKTDE